MNNLKKILGWLWLLSGIVFACWLPYEAVIKLNAAKANTEDFVFWIIITTIFTPIILGFILFGFYALKGEYNTNITEQ